MNKKVHGCLIVFAAIQTLLLNGILETNDYVGWMQVILSAPRIYLVVLEIMGQYEALCSLSKYARDKIFQRTDGIRSPGLQEKQIKQQILRPSEIVRRKLSARARYRLSRGHTSVMRRNDAKTRRKKGKAGAISNG